MISVKVFATKSLLGPFSLLPELAPVSREIIVSEADMTRLTGARRGGFLGNFLLYRRRDSQPSGPRAALAVWTRGRGKEAALDHGVVYLGEARNNAWSVVNISSPRGKEVWSTINAAYCECEKCEHSKEADLVLIGVPFSSEGAIGAGVAGDPSILARELIRVIEGMVVATNVSRHAYGWHRVDTSENPLHIKPSEGTEGYSLVSEANFKSKEEN